MYLVKNLDSCIHKELCSRSVLSDYYSLDFYPKICIYCGVKGTSRSLTNSTECYPKCESCKGPFSSGEGSSKNEQSYLKSEQVNNCILLKKRCSCHPYSDACSVWCIFWGRNRKPMCGSIDSTWWLAEPARVPPPPIEVLRMSQKLQIKESNRKDVIELLILNEKKRFVLVTSNFDATTSFTGIRLKCKKCTKNETHFVEVRLTPFFSLSVANSFLIANFQILWIYAENEHLTSYNVRLTRNSQCLRP